MAELDLRDITPLPAISIERYWAKIERRGDDECWLWTGSLTKGYGLIRIGGQGFYAHRLAWFLRHGVDPKPLFVLHKCDVRACCNPAHLFLGTAADNIHDCMAKGRFPAGDTHYAHIHPELRPRGEMLHQTKLTEAEVIEIRRLRATGLYTYTALEAMFQVGRHSLHALVHRRTWRHVP